MTKWLMALGVYHASCYDQVLTGFIDCFRSDTYTCNVLSDSIISDAGWVISNKNTCLLHPAKYNLSLNA